MPCMGGHVRQILGKANAPRCGVRKTCARTQGLVRQNVRKIRPWRTPRGLCVRGNGPTAHMARVRQRRERIGALRDRGSDRLSPPKSRRRTRLGGRLASRSPTDNGPEFNPFGQIPSPRGTLLTVGESPAISMELCTVGSHPGQPKGVEGLIELFQEVSKSCGRGGRCLGRAWGLAL
jgi:hypothetical protein